MKHYRAQTNTVVAAMGYTDLFVIPYTDLTAEAIADNTPKVITLDGLVLGDMVRQDVLVEISKLWAGPGDLTGTVSVGVTSAETTFTPTRRLINAGTGDPVGNAETSDNQTNPHYVAATGINLIANFAADADSGVDEYTAGEVRIWMNISRQADRARIEA